jgi:putative spermidine/putrescine transport system permease protein
LKFVAPPERRVIFLVAVPFVAFVGLFLIFPSVIVVYDAFTPDGQLGFSSVQTALTGSYGRGFYNSTVLGLTTALIGGAFGVLLAVTMRDLKRPKWVHSTVDSWSAVASQLGGVPLGFAFIATLGAQGLITKAFMNAGLDLGNYGVSVSGFWGLVVVYLYFQIPLMFLVTVPALNGLRQSWRESAQILGASSWVYWLRIGVPVLAPAAIGGMLLLFVNSFAAYATVYVLNPSAQLVPLQIRFLLQGNVISGEEDLGNAIVACVIGLLLLSLLVMTYLQRRTMRWVQS